MESIFDLLKNKNFNNKSMRRSYPFLWISFPCWDILFHFYFIKVFPASSILKGLLWMELPASSWWSIIELHKLDDVVHKAHRLNQVIQPSANTTANTGNWTWDSTTCYIYVPKPRLIRKLKLVTFIVGPTVKYMDILGTYR